jgi:hypothetical protein
VCRPNARPVALREFVQRLFLCGVWWRTGELARIPTRGGKRRSASPTAASSARRRHAKPAGELASVLATDAHRRPAARRPAAPPRPATPRRALAAGAASAVTAPPARPRLNATATGAAPSRYGSRGRLRPGRPTGRRRRAAPRCARTGASAPGRGCSRRGRGLPPPGRPTLVECHDYWIQHQ